MDIQLLEVANKALSDALERAEKATPDDTGGGIIQ
jgi:hypothetical protein